MTDLEIARQRIAQEMERKTGRLDLKGLEIDEIPAEVGDLRHLEGLKIGGELLGGKSEIADLGVVAELGQLRELDCSKSLVADLTPLSGLTSLSSLDCYATEVSDLSPLSGLTSLSSLDCSWTQVSDLSPLSGLMSLSILTCSWTQVSDLSPLSGLANLSSLSCSWTEVSDLSPLSGLTSLSRIACWRTRVSDLSPLVHLGELVLVDADDCEVENLPRNLVFSSSLRVLYLGRARISGVPSEVLSQGLGNNCLERLRNHLQDLAGGEEEIRDAKLLVLGNGRVGKTQICRRLRGLDFDESVPSTHGIHISTAPQPGIEPGERGELHIWDFGGQDIYHGTHALFLRTRAIFLIVWTPELETRGEFDHGGIVFRDFPLPHWLEYVRHLGGSGSPVVLIQSQCDRPEQERPILPVEERYLKFGFQRVGCYSAKTNRRRASLDEALHDAADYLREREGVAVIGAGRMRVKRKLEAWREADLDRGAAEREHRTLTLLEFENLCREAGGVSSPAALLDYFHNIGLVFHRPGLFGDRILLDQSWALEAVYAVFDRKASYRQLRHMRGRFTRSFLGETVWRGYAESDQELFLSLMKSCGVCFEHREADRKREIEAEYIAPDLLPAREEVEGELAGRWSGEEPVAEHRYEFPFLSQAVIRSAISAIGRLAGESAVYWKEGVWGYESRTGARVMVEQRMEGDQRGAIVVECQGGRREELLARVRELLERLTNFREGLPDLERRARGRAEHAEDGGAGEALDPEGIPEKKPAADALRFADAPPETLGKVEPEIYLSYAWGDDTPEGRRREELADQVCKALDASGVRIIRDKNEMGAGDRITPFMKRLAEGDFIVAVISDKYLRSPYCMYELYHIFRNCGQNPDRFLGKVVPLIMPDARIASGKQRLQYVKHWKSEKEELGAEIREIGPDYVDEETYNEFKLIQEFAEKTGKILTYLNDKLVPRDFDRMAAEGFRELVDLLQCDPR